MRRKKEDRFTIAKVKTGNGKTSYRVSGYLINGDRIRKNFKDKTDALEFKNHKEIESEQGATSFSLERTRLTRVQLADAEMALEQVGNRSLSEQATHYHSLEQRVAKVSDIGIEGAIAFFEKHYRPEIKELSVYTAVARFLTTRQDLASESQAYYKKCTGLLVSGEPGKMLHQFTAHDVELILAKYYKAASYRTYRRGINVFFNWAVRAQHCLENPCSHLERAPKRTRNIVILNLEETKRLLKAATVLQNGAAAASIAILLFAGLRPSELFDLKKTDIREGYIVVSGGKLRGRSKRRAPIPDVLRVWLHRYPFEALPGGWYYKMTQLKKATAAKQWVSDVLRHTSISFQLERERNEAEVAFHNGTSVGMINLHYRDLIEDPADAIKFWQLTPEEIADTKLKVNLAGHQKVEWPSNIKLKKLVWEQPLSLLAKDLDVSDNAIRKRCKQRDIELPQKGHWQREIQLAKSRV